MRSFTFSIPAFHPVLRDGMGCGGTFHQPLTQGMVCKEV
jgi:hypothetical protein